MVRLKHRYLLVNILYPEQQPAPSFSTPNSISPIVSIHRPSPDGLTPVLLARIIRECVSELFGDWGVGKLGGANAGRVNAIIRCPRESYRLVCAALTLINAIPTSRNANFPLASLLTTPITSTSGSATFSSDRIPCVFHVVRVSGTIKKAEEEAIRRARRDIARLMHSGDVKAGGDGEGDNELLDRILGTMGRKKVGGMGIDHDENEDDDDDEQDESDDLQE
ncbi:hypothetical protein KEM54_006844 [Ascosphaera aggregata]|nr:hypothetical protein KEM54_006844 [Ascosphaera aggregata]